MLKWGSGSFSELGKRSPYLINWCLENTLPEDVDLNLFKCYGILSIIGGAWKLNAEIYSNGL